MHLLLWLIFRQSYPNFINVRTAYASKNLDTTDKKIFSQNQAQKDSESTSDNYGGNYVQGKTYRICKQDEFKSLLPDIDTDSIMIEQSAVNRLAFAACRIFLNTLIQKEFR